MRRLRLMALALAVAGGVLVFPLGSFGLPGSNTWSGTWNGSYDDLKLVQSGSSVSGTYPYDKGKIKGTVSGNVLTGTWSEAPTYAGPDDAGPVKWTLSSSGHTFTGSWSYAGRSGGGDWHGGCTAGPCLQNGELDQDVTKWHYSFDARNRIDSHSVGRGTISEIKRGATTSWRAAGTVVHVDEYFTKDQDEHLTLRVYAGSVSSKPDKRYGGGEARLKVIVTRSDQANCPVGTRGTLFAGERDTDEDEYQDAEVHLKVCGGEHDHRYVHRSKYPVRVDIAKSG